MTVQEELYKLLGIPEFIWPGRAAWLVETRDFKSRVVLVSVNTIWVRMASGSYKVTFGISDSTGKELCEFVKVTDFFQDKTAAAAECSRRNQLGTFTPAPSFPCRPPYPPGHRAND